MKKEIKIHEILSSDSKLSIIKLYKYVISEEKDHTFQTFCIMNIADHSLLKLID